MKPPHRKLHIILVAGLLAIVVLSAARVLPIYFHLDGKAPEVSAYSIQEGSVYGGVVDIAVCRFDGCPTADKTIP